MNNLINNFVCPDCGRCAQIQDVTKVTLIKTFNVDKIDPNSYNEFTVRSREKSETLTEAYYQCKCGKKLARDIKEMVNLLRKDTKQVNTCKKGLDL